MCSSKAFDETYSELARDLRASVQALTSSEIPQWRVLQLRCALLLSSISNVAANLPSSLVIKSVERGILPPRLALHWSSFQQPYERAKIVRYLAPSLSQDDREDALKKAILARGYGFYLSVGQLAPLLSRDDRDKVFAETVAEVSAIRDPHARSEAFADIAEGIPFEVRTDVVAKARNAASAIRGNDLRAMSFLRIAQIAPLSERKRLFELALEAARNVKRDVPRAKVLGSIAAKLAENERLGPALESLTAAKSYRSSSGLEDADCANALASIAEILPSPQLALAVEVARSRLIAWRLAGRRWQLLPWVFAMKKVAI